MTQELDSHRIFGHEAMENDRPIPLRRPPAPTKQKPWKTCEHRRPLQDAPRPRTRRRCRCHQSTASPASSTLSPHTVDVAVAMVAVSVAAVFTFRVEQAPPIHFSSVLLPNAVMLADVALVATIRFHATMRRICVAADEAAITVAANALADGVTVRITAMPTDVTVVTEIPDGPLKSEPNAGKPTSSV